MSKLYLNLPQLALRYHRNISPKIVDQAIDLLHLGMGHPSVFNEDLMQKACLRRGYSPEEAKRVEMVACVTNVVNGMYVVSTGAWASAA